MDLLRRRRFLLLLVTIGLLLVIYPVVRDAVGGRLFFHVLLTLVLVAAWYVLFTQWRLRVLALLFGIPALVGAWTGYALPAPRLVAGFHAAAALFLAVTVAAILQAILREETVSADTICGAFCGYLLVGVAFSHLYCMVDSLSPGSFRDRVVLATPPADEHRYFLLTYFSLVTLTTVGYGDIVPTGGAARALVAIEAVLGQFYIAVLIAQLVGIRVSQARAGPGP
jgi:hypothetical protein